MPQTASSTDMQLTDTADATLAELVEHLEDIPVFIQLDSTSADGGVFIGVLDSPTDRLAQVILHDDGAITDLVGQPLTLDEVAKLGGSIVVTERRNTQLNALAYAAHEMLATRGDSDPEYRRGLVEAIVTTARLQALHDDAARQVAEDAITSAAGKGAPSRTWTAEDVAQLTEAIADLNQLDDINASYAQAQIGLWAHITGLGYSRAERALRFAV